MHINDELSATGIPGACVLTLGVFDGVHLGHRHLLEQVKAQALAQQTASAVITFRNHPGTVLRPDQKPSYISSIKERVDLLRTTGIDHVIPITFTQEISQYTPRQFIELLVNQLRMKGLVIGPDFALGKDRLGTTSILQELGKAFDYTVAVAEPYIHEGLIVSTTAIRKCLSSGAMSTAAALLGRPVSLKGQVVKGDQRGRTLGFPTANLAIPTDIALPIDGIYCTVAHVAGRRHDSVTSIGVRPTFGISTRTVETFIMNFSEDLYGEPLSLDVLQRIRDEIRFDDIDELIKQMHKDVDTATQILSGLSTT